MCGLCQMQLPFAAPLVNPMEQDKLRAKQLKHRVVQHEEEAQKRVAQGSPPCVASAKRLQAMRDEQYELARRL